MICNRCGREISNVSTFCPFCGNQINIVNSQNNQNSFKEKKKKNILLSKKQQIIIFSLLGVITLLLGALLILPNNDTRTVMLYIVGSDLETDNGIVTADLDAIDPSKIDLDKTNILLYTGGTKEWHNFISNKENAIYILKDNGFEKLEAQKQLNLGDPGTLSSFLKYGYENYKADKYDLILYDHGGALDGAIYDDFSNDNLSLEDMSKALNDSPFNKKNKLDAVLFRTCLNGTWEIANTFKDFSDYLIASEEISYGSGITNVLGFLNNVYPKDNGLVFGKKYIDSYEVQMETIDKLEMLLRTYSVIDLSKLDNLNKELDKYIQGIDITKNYKNISLARSNLYQYGSTESSFYDTVDLYELVNSLSKYATSDVNSLLMAINNAIKYNMSNSENSHGLSIYFPYNANKGAKKMFLKVYENLNYSQEYKKFINTFNNMQQSPSGYSFSFDGNKITSNEDRTGFSMELSDEQLETFSIGLFAIFERDPEHPDYYKLLFSSDDTTLDNKILTANINNMMLKINNDDDNFEYIKTFYRKKNNNIRTVDATLYRKDADFSDDNYMNSVTLMISNDSNNPSVFAAKLKSKNERIDGTLLDLNDFDKVEMWNGTYKILDDNGNYTDEWESAPSVSGYSDNLSELELKNSGLDKGDNYYGLFILNDIYGNTSYSKLIKVGE